MLLRGDLSRTRKHVILLKSLSRDVIYLTTDPVHTCLPRLPVFLPLPETTCVR